MRIATAFGTNLAGQVLRLAIAVLTVPLFAAYFGAARFGTYYFLLALMPYFQVHALAVSRQVTALSARAEAGEGRLQQMRAELGSSVAIGTIISVVLTTAFFVGYPWMMQGVESAEALAAEIARARPWAAAIVVLDVVIVLQTAQMEGRKAFAPSNIAQITGQAATLLLPLTAFIYDGSFDRMIAGVALARLVQVLVGLRWAPLLPILALVRSGLRMPRSLGIDFGMLTVSAICNAVSRTLDRIVIGTSASAAALYFYSAPMGGTARLSMLGRSMGATMAPFFATGEADQRRVQAAKASNAVLALLFPVCAFGIVSAPLLMTVWVDAEFAERGTTFFRLGLIGVMGSSVAQVPAVLMQSTGRSKFVTVQQLIELPPFAFALLWASTHNLVAVAWVVALRMVVSGLVQMTVAGVPRRAIAAAIACIAAAVALSLAAPSLDHLPPLSALAAGGGAALGASLIVHLLSPDTMRFACELIVARLHRRQKTALPYPERNNGP
ncbi:polysaccharide biosynthesis protein [Erythrobacter litoralis HTCC2594]|uniref:Polysaccharide biosynthesis protein n=2 Tax=Erythrobacter litoralis TaxID=39960 RepID=Q2N713_ERYLH|nr:polysaccharide biosynthesis protein [Erythrobacter litoralis HTCC2594]